MFVFNVSEGRDLWILQLSSLFPIYPEGFPAAILCIFYGSYGTYILGCVPIIIYQIISGNLNYDTQTKAIYEQCDPFYF